MLSVPAEDLLELVGDRALSEHVEANFKNIKPSMIDHAGDMFAALSGPAGALLTKVAQHTGKSIAYGVQRNRLLKLIATFIVSRPTISLTDRDKALFRAAADLTAERVYSPDQWRRHLALTVWNDSVCKVEAPPGYAHHKGIGDARYFLIQTLKATLPDNATFIADAAADAARHAKASAAATAASFPPGMSTGSHWMTERDLASSSFYATTDSPPGLILGYDPATDQPVYFSGAESLITIGGPGSGKSQAHVIPNLLAYKGSAIILDVKGELWRTTAGYRQRHHGKVYRFAPTDPSGNTHRYNPFDFISKKPDEAANDCSIFSYQVIEDNPNLKEPYWENRGRDFFWAFALYIALKAEGEDRTIQGLGELLSTPLSKQPDADIHLIISSMKRLAARIGISDLKAAADALTTGVAGKDRLESIVDTARRFLSIFNRSPHVAAAMKTSDWRPEYFRSRPGTTLYICLSPAELKTYAPVVRTMLIQHARILQSYGAGPGEQAYAAKPGECPITFFLDEMPQLGNFKSILELQDVGRGAGLRLWMFAQTLGQLSEAFGSDRFEGIVDACRARCFLQPDNQAARLVEPNLGRTKNLFTGSDEPLATASDLMGRAYQDKVILTSRGDHPMVLNKRYAWKTGANTFLPPPNIRP